MENIETNCELENFVQKAKIKILKTDNENERDNSKPTKLQFHLLLACARKTKSVVSLQPIFSVDEQFKIIKTTGGIDLTFHMLRVRVRVCVRSTSATVPKAQQRILNVCSEVGHVLKSNAMKSILSLCTVDIRMFEWMRVYVSATNKLATN